MVKCVGLSVISFLPPPVRATSFRRHCISKRALRATDRALRRILNATPPDRPARAQKAKALRLWRSGRVLLTFQTVAACGVPDRINEYITLRTHCPPMGGEEVGVGLPLIGVVKLSCTSASKRIRVCNGLRYIAHGINWPAQRWFIPELLSRNFCKVFHTACRTLARRAQIVLKWKCTWKRGVGS